MPRTTDPEPEPFEPLGEKVETPPVEQPQATHVRGKVWKLPDGRYETRDYEPPCPK